MLTDEDGFNQKTDELNIYVTELFAGEPTTFMPSENAAVPIHILVALAIN